jgi:hypothetical protein
VTFNRRSRQSRVQAPSSQLRSVRSFVSPPAQQAPRDPGNDRPSHSRWDTDSVGVVDSRNEVREFLVSRRAKITPEQAGLPAYGGNRRVPGLRREEVALLAGVSVDYYTRLERGNLNGVSESVLDALGHALQLPGPSTDARRGAAASVSRQGPA